MIAKHVAMKSVQKSSFEGLVSYMLNEQGKSERIGYVSVTNCQSERTDAAVLEISNTQQKNTRAESDKTYHLVLSFAPGENPSDKVLQEIEDRICNGLGFGEHQRISVAHHDTDNLHIHIAINKIHPTRYTILDPYYGHKTLGNLCEKLEKEYGFQLVNHQSQNTQSENKAADMEHHSGIESFLGWIKRECLEQIKKATTWEKLHQVMLENGLELRERGNGFVITNQDGLMVKASSVARELSKNGLETKLGSFVPFADKQQSGTNKKPEKKYEPRPTKSRIDTVELFAKYQTEQRNNSALQKAELTKVRERKIKLIETAKHKGQLKRLAIKQFNKSGVVRKIFYTLTSKALKAEIKAINIHSQKEREVIYDKFKRQQWVDWLRQKAVEGDKEALAALRARQNTQSPKDNTFVGAGKQQYQEVNAHQDSITKKGTIIYRAGASAIRDDGDRLKVSRESTGDCLEIALRMAIERYGNRITVNGSKEFKEQMIVIAATSNLSVTFTDAAMEDRRQTIFKNSNTQERSNESTNRGRRTGGSSGGAGYASSRESSNSAENGNRIIGGATKPNIGRVGTKPPPESKNRLRNLSSLDVVRFTEGSEVLLQGNVPDSLEQSRTKSNNTLRRNVSGAGLAAAEKYVVKREQKRLSGIDILVHKPYNNHYSSNFLFAGFRKVDDQLLVLLKHNDEILVKPIDETTARKMKHLSIGDKVTINQQGVIKTKGRSR